LATGHWQYRRGAASGNPREQATGGRDERRENGTRRLVPEGGDRQSETEKEGVEKGTDELHEVDDVL
jgi:hypothetical protein